MAKCRGCFNEVKRQPVPYGYAGETRWVHLEKPDVCIAYEIQPLINEF